MTLDQLETFIAIAEQGGLRAASKVLNKTQPTLSTGMKNLEEELGVVLLNRESYRVKLTEEGKALLKEAKDMADNAPSVVKEAAPKSEAEEVKKKLEEAGATVTLK